MIMTERDIHLLYARTMPQTEYFEKWEQVPEFPGQKEDGPWNKHRQWDGHDFPRVWCVLDFIEWTKNISGEHFGFTCEHDPEIEFIASKYSRHTYIPYPPYDLHQMPVLPDPFDFFLFNQTLEHLYDQNLAVSNIAKNMNPGGYVFTSVPTINIPHMTPVHFGGLTPMGLAVLFHRNDFDVVNLGQWGNNKYIETMFKTQSWPDYNFLKDESGCVPNEPQNCCQCWILAKKRGSK